MNTMTINTHTGDTKTVEVDLKAPIYWDACEWDDKVDARSAEFYGYSLDVTPNEVGNGFSWMVRATYAVSEYPECEAAGVAKRSTKIASAQEVAMWHAERAARRAVKGLVAREAGRA